MKPIPSRPQVVQVPTATATEEGTNNGPGAGGWVASQVEVLVIDQCLIISEAMGALLAMAEALPILGSINTPWGQSGLASSENTSSTSTTSSTSQTTNTGRPTPPDFASQTSSSSSTNTSTTISSSANQPATNAPAMTATNTALSNQNTPTSNPSSSEGASLKSNTSLANQPTKEQPTQIMTNATSRCPTTSS